MKVLKIKDARLNFPCKWFILEILFSSAQLGYLQLLQLIGLTSVNYPVISRYCVSEVLKILTLYYYLFFFLLERN